MKLAWKDATSYSRDDKDRTPRTWSVEIIPGMRAAVTRRHGLNGWYLNCEPWFTARPLESIAIEDAKAEAEALLKSRAAAMLKAING